LAAQRGIPTDPFAVAVLHLHPLDRKDCSSVGLLRAYVSRLRLLMVALLILTAVGLLIVPSQREVVVARLARRCNTFFEKANKVKKNDGFGPFDLAPARLLI